eukprot:1974732-Alexandrium_andersonii.AAC.1
MGRNSRLGRLLDHSREKKANGGHRCHAGGRGRRPGEGGGPRGRGDAHAQGCRARARGRRRA